MTIKQQGGIFGRNPTFNNVDVEKGLTVSNDGTTVLTVNRNTSDGDIIEVQKNNITLGSIGSNSSSIYALSGDTGILLYDFDNEILPIGYSASTRDGEISLGRAATRFNNLYLAGNVVVASGQGIDFSATSGTGTSELFDDYEEGTFSPVITTQTSGSITLNASQDLLSYTKTGRVVHVTGLLSVSSVASPVGNFVTISLPFTSANLPEFASATYTSWMYLDLPSYSQDFKPMSISKNVSVATLSIDASTISANEQLRFSFSYIAA